MLLYSYCMFCSSSSGMGKWLFWPYGVLVWRAGCGEGLDGRVDWLPLLRVLLVEYKASLFTFFWCWILPASWPDISFQILSGALSSAEVCDSDEIHLVAWMVALCCSWARCPMPTNSQWRKWTPSSMTCEQAEAAMAPALHVWLKLLKHRDLRQANIPLQVPTSK